MIDPLLEPPRYAKAVGIQPRTLEVFENMGVLKTVLDASMSMRGQIVYTNGEQVGRIELALPADVPFGFAMLPQYETERILAERLAELGTEVERGVGVVSVHQDAHGVTATTSDSAIDHVQYVIGCGGAHSVVRKQLGLTFEGDAFAEAYMLGDVEVDWTQPTGYGIRIASTATDGTTTGLLVAIPCLDGSAIA